MINLLFQFFRNEGKQQGERVAIAALRILRKIAIHHHVLQEESANPGAELAVVSQQPPPLQQTLQNADWPAETVPESSSGTSVCGTSGGGPNRLRGWAASNLHRRRFCTTRPTGGRQTNAEGRVGGAGSVRRLVDEPLRSYASG